MNIFIISQQTLFIIDGVSYGEVVILLLDSRMNRCYVDNIYTVFILVKIVDHVSHHRHQRAMVKLVSQNFQRKSQA